MSELTRKVLELDTTATRGPWHYVDQPPCCVVNEDHWDLYTDDPVCNVACATGKETDIDLITTYRAAAPELARRVERLETFVAAFDAWIQDGRRVEDYIIAFQDLLEERKKL